MHGYTTFGMRVKLTSSKLLVRTFFGSSILRNNVIKTYKFHDIKQLIENPVSGKVLVDVREPQEHMQYAIPTSVNIPVNTAPGALGLLAEEFQKTFNFNKPELSNELVFYCKSGTRAKAAEELARSYGYQNTAIYHGSITDWLKKHGDRINLKN
ncbi:similar to Saccharomyces cerevisiae YOR286W RDL2 Protein with rhodanese activity [Maudiozyma saulgeensis]|uniref:Similar to Saccharomyces cerevisiae YOR286W RDL2 Protein with rhodanese activity n=1 Tax=Maudiozyma saulgeensis TaxID=1789683 RepID=A0A1X7R8U5_9SACH|nr:similar to Saccharomyces cerevisiae YOR286W RDL2 Protein with rhodanese activity [Kazachstania saulgeensis]